MTLAFSAMTASAQYISTKEVGNANGWTAFTADPVARMASYEGAKVTIFNEDFTEHKSFSLALGSNETITQMDQIVVSQHLFNQDDLFEVVVISNGSYKVYNERSEMLGTIPSNLLMSVGGKNYIYTYNDGVYKLYALESRTEGVESVLNDAGLRVYPNPVNAGEMVRFQLPAQTKADIDVYNAAGAHELRRADGEGTVEIPAEELGRGVHPYTVTEKDGKSHTGKLIVR